MRSSDSDTITESGVFRILTEPDEIGPPLAPRHIEIRCARCDMPTPHLARICPHCQLYLGMTKHTWRIALEDAIRYLKTGRR